MSIKLIDQLRREIDAKHQRAIKALEAFAELEGYVGEDAIRKALGVQSSSTKVQAPPADEDGEGEDEAGPGQPSGESIRAKVVSVIRGEWGTVNLIAQMTGLSIKQVRGVINAPHLIGTFEKRETNGTMEYKAKEQQ